MRTPVLKTRRLILNKLTEKDLPFFVEWLNDDEVIKYLSVAYLQPLTMAKERKWYQKMKKEKDGLTLAIRIKKDKNLIGTIGLKGINLNEKTADLGIAISNKNYWGKGLGPEAIKALLKYAFSKLKLNNVFLWAHKRNKRAIKAYKKVGFRIMGTRRKAIHMPKKKKPEDLIYMDIIKNDLK